MTVTIDNEGTISLYQGDTGEIVVDGLNPEFNYYVFFAVRDDKNQLLAEELKLSSNNKTTVSFFLSADFTDKLIVPQYADFQVYYYGIKTIKQGSSQEDTLFVEGSDYGDKNLIIVYPKKVEGNC